MFRLGLVFPDEMDLNEWNWMLCVLLFTIQCREKKRFSPSCCVEITNRLQSCNIWTELWKLSELWWSQTALVSCRSIPYVEGGIIKFRMTTVSVFVHSFIVRLHNPPSIQLVGFVYGFPAGRFVSRGWKGGRDGSQKNCVSTSFSLPRRFA